MTGDESGRRGSGATAGAADDPGLTRMDPMLEGKRWVVGVDIGGTNLGVGVLPVGGGELRAHRQTATHGEEGGEAVVGRVVAMVEEAIAEVLEEEGGGRDSFAGIGIGSPGPLDREAGRVIDTPNLGWRDFPVRDLVAEAVGLPAELDNDANCAAFGEWWMGAGRGSRSVVAITLGTGIGGGIVLDGHLLHGASDAAGEIGHTTIDFTGRRCACGNYGCLEAYASGPNIAARAREGLEPDLPSVLLDLAGGDPDAITSATVYEAAVQGDAYAAEIVAETAKILGVGIANVVNVLNPEVVVITGGVTRAGERLFAPLRKEVRRRAFRVAEQACRIVPAALPETAGVVGAAGMFLDAHGGIERAGGA